jgi:hypothetical protein
LNKTATRARNKNPWTTKQYGDIVINQSPLLAGQTKLVHAFTTRHGGKSPTPADTFNLGKHLNTDESRADALANRRALCHALGLNFDHLSVPAQVHSSIVLIADERTAYPDVDGLVTDQPDKPLLLHFADCVPVMIFDCNRQVLCIVHAGWRGTAGTIAKNGVQLMEQKFGCRPADMVAAVGPAIGSCCYPTGGDVAEKLSKTVSSAEGMFVERDGNVCPDLKAINALQLLESGVGEVDVTELCTACNPQTFYSHRQSGGKTGRQGAIASII